MTTYESADLYMHKFNKSMRIFAGLLSDIYEYISMCPSRLHKAMLLQSIVV